MLRISCLRLFDGAALGEPPGVTRVAISFIVRGQCHVLSQMSGNPSSSELSDDGGFGRTAFDGFI